MKLVSSVRDLRAALLDYRLASETVAMVPTMGALHRGHMALIDAAKQVAGRVVASIFVNPLQFAPTEDLGRYPRQLEADQKLLVEHGCDLLYVPTAEDLYPNGFSVSIDPGPVAKPLEGEFRPGHFEGVATVVSKLLLQAMPDVACFGEKDYQQLQVIRRVTRDLNIPVQIVGVPIVRDDDGLALSSRNAYLSPEERQRATVLPQTLMEIAASIKDGAPVTSTLNVGRDRLSNAGFVVDYLCLADAATLQPVSDLHHPARLLVAAKLGTTRLIDNIGVG